MQKASAGRRNRLLRLRSLGALLVALVPTVLLVVAQAVGAGTYMVSACSPTSSTGGLRLVNTFPPGLTVGNLCGGPATGPNEPQGPTDEGALFTEDSTNTTANIPNGAEAGWSFTAPIGTSITSITYWRSLHAYNQQSLVPGLWTGEGMTLESCQSPPEGTHECNSLNNQGPKTFTNLNASSLFFGVRCSLVGGGEFCVPAGPGERHAQADLYSANVTLSEESSPTVSSISGAGWSGGFLSGQVPLTFSASDYSGIASVEVRSSLGGALASALQSCDYYNAVPCPVLSQATVTLNTAAVSDGAQTLVLVVRNAAGNTTSVSSQPLTIDNHGPGAPIGLVATLDGARVVLSWRNPAFVSVPLAKGYVQLCQASCGAPLAVASTGLARISIPPAGAYTVRLYLTDAAGKSSPAASVTLAVLHGVGKGKKRLRALIDSRGRLYVAGSIPASVKGHVRVCWRSVRGRHTLGGRCVRLRVRRGRISVIFHPSTAARRGVIVVSVSSARKLLARVKTTT